MNEANLTYAGFAGDRLVASGTLTTLLAQAKAHLDRGGDPSLVIFEDQTGLQVDFDFRGSLDEVLARAAPVPPRPGPGRPRLGVVSREVSLLPRHWEFLERQPNGISAALRRLVDEARKREPDEGRARAAQEAASRFMWAMAGNLPGFEEASRALFAADKERFERLTRDWPADIRAHLLRVTRDAFEPTGRRSPRPSARPVAVRASAGAGRPRLR
jgi:hypothetical protein